MCGLEGLEGGIHGGLSGLRPRLTNNKQIRHTTGANREAQARVREDDEIIEALGRYTSKLQLSLKIINSATEHE